MIRWLVILLVFVGGRDGLAQGAGSRDYELKPDPNPFVTKFFGIFGPVLIHETGHALTGVSLGGTLESFKPFPHMSQGRLVGGSVQTSGISGWKMTTTTIMGSGMNVLFVLAAAPMLPHFKNVQNRYVLDEMLGYASLDLLGYTIADTLGFEGDWQEVADTWGVPVWTLIPVGAAVWWGLQSYHLKYANQKPDDAIIESRPSSVASLPLPVLRWGQWLSFLGHDPGRNHWYIGIMR